MEQAKRATARWAGERLHSTRSSSDGSLRRSLKESMATGKTLLAAKADPTSNELIKLVVSDFETG
jgi:hypothetical protein